MYQIKSEAVYNYIDRAELDIDRLTAAVSAVFGQYTSGQVLSFARKGKKATLSGTLSKGDDVPVPARFAVIDRELSRLEKAGLRIEVNEFPVDINMWLGKFVTVQS